MTVGEDGADGPEQVWSKLRAEEGSEDCPVLFLKVGDARHSYTPSPKMSLSSPRSSTAKLQTNSKVSSQHANDNDLRSHAL